MPDDQKHLEQDIAAAFLRVLDEAVPAYEFTPGLFDAEQERFITREVERMLYEPKLPNGGSRERRMVERFAEMAKERDWDGAWRAQRMAALFTEMEGRYYKRTPLVARTNKAEHEWVTALRDSAHKARDWDRKWFCQQLLEGSPEAVSDFRVECLFLVEKPDGTVDRLIRLVNVRRESTLLISMDATAFHAPTKFREFCLRHGNYAWQGGEKELQKLHEDVNRATAYRQVKQIVTFGWHALGKRPGADGLMEGIWFYEDSAFYNGQTILADDDGIYWVTVDLGGGAQERKGFRVGEFSREGEFVQERPRMRPELKAEQVKWMVQPNRDPATPEEEALRQTLAAPAEVTVPKTEEESLAYLFRTLGDNLCLNLGGLDGLLALGTVLSYVAAPETYAAEKSFPSVWIHGVKGSGKTTLCRTLMALHGMCVPSGLNLISKQVTAVGLAQALDQYSNIPVWADEFRNHQIGEDKLTLIRAGYDRASSAKFNPGGVQRRVHTNFLVSGETTTSDAATRSRFALVQVSAASRMGSEEAQRDRLAWLERHNPHFCLLVRALILRRREFVTTFRSVLSAWYENRNIHEIEARLRSVYGISYAALLAANQIWEVYPQQTMVALRDFLVQHSKMAAADVASDVNINVFWTDFFAAFADQAIPLSCFLLKSRRVEHPPGRPDQGSWYSHTLYMDPELTIANMKIYLTRMRGAVVLNRNDLRDQLSKEPYWIPGTHSKYINRSSKKVWAISVDLHPDGYQAVTTEEYMAAQVVTTGEDPRKGRLFEVVEALLSKANEVRDP